MADEKVRVYDKGVQIGNGEGEGACEVHNPGYDFNDAALPYGISYWAQLVETALPARTAATTNDSWPAPRPEVAWR